MSRERVGVMVIRLWSEESDTDVRARLTRTLDIVEAQEETNAVVGTDAVLTAVRQFVEAFRDSQRAQPLS
jgi:broad specificity phosphatase PhoE